MQIDKVTNIVPAAPKKRGGARPGAGAKKGSTFKQTPKQLKENMEKQKKQRSWDYIQRAKGLSKDDPEQQELRNEVARRIRKIRKASAAEMLNNIFFEVYIENDAKNMSDFLYRHGSHYIQTETNLNITADNNGVSSFEKLMELLQNQHQGAGNDKQS